jgi:hypothetical protein
MEFDLIMIYTKLMATSNILNLVDKRHLRFLGKAHFLLIFSTCNCCTLILVKILVEILLPFLLYIAHL